MENSPCFDSISAFQEITFIAEMKQCDEADLVKDINYNSRVSVPPVVTGLCECPASASFIISSRDIRTNTGAGRERKIDLHEKPPSGPEEALKCPEDTKLKVRSVRTPSACQDPTMAQMMALLALLSYGSGQGKGPSSLGAYM